MPSHRKKQQRGADATRQRKNARQSNATKILKDNKFEVKVNKRKHQILGQKTLSQEKGRPGLAKARDMSTRTATLLKDYTRLTRDSEFRDQRLSDPTARMSAAHSVQIRRNIGKDTTAIASDDYFFPLNKSRSDKPPGWRENVRDLDDDTRDYSDNFVHGQISAEQVASGHFGGGCDEDEDDQAPPVVKNAAISEFDLANSADFAKHEADLIDTHAARLSGPTSSAHQSNKRALSTDWRTRMSDMIADSKAAKFEKQRDRDSARVEVAKLDTDWSRVRHLFKEELASNRRKFLEAQAATDGKVETAKSKVDPEPAKLQSITEDKSYLSSMMSKFGVNPNDRSDLKPEMSKAVDAIVQKPVVLDLSNVKFPATTTPKTTEDQIPSKSLVVNARHNDYDAVFGQLRAVHKVWSAERAASESIVNREMESKNAARLAAQRREELFARMANPSLLTGVASAPGLIPDKRVAKKLNRADPTGKLFESAQENVRMHISAEALEETVLAAEREAFGLDGAANGLGFVGGSRNEAEDGNDDIVPGSANMDKEAMRKYMREAEFDGDAEVQDEEEGYAAMMDAVAQDSTKSGGSTFETRSLKAPSEHSGAPKSSFSMLEPVFEETDVVYEDGDDAESDDDSMNEDADSQDDSDDDDVDGYDEEGASSNDDGDENSDDNSVEDDDGDLPSLDTFQFDSIDDYLTKYRPDKSPKNLARLRVFFGHAVTKIMQEDEDSLVLVSRYSEQLFKLHRVASASQSRHAWKLGQCIRKHLSTRVKDWERDPAWKTPGPRPSQPDAALIALISLLYPTSDFWHPLTSPALHLCTSFLATCKFDSVSNVARGLAFASLCLRYVHLSKRLVPELISFVNSALACFVKHSTLKTLKTGLSHKISLRLTLKSDSVAEPYQINELFHGNVETPKLFASILKIFSQISTMYTDKTGFHFSRKIFDALVMTFSKLPSIEANISTLSKAIEYEAGTLHPAMKYLDSTRIVAFRSFVPKYPMNLSDGITRREAALDISKQREETKRLKKSLKKESKAAVRELRKDAAFLANEKLKQTMKNDALREKKTNRIKAQLQMQEGEYKKLRKVNLI